MTGQDHGDSVDPPSPDQAKPAEGRWRRYETKVRHRLSSATEAAESRRSKSVLFDTGFQIWDRNRVLPASVLVGAMASRIVIYLIPLFALVIFSFGLYQNVGNESAAEALRSAGMPALFAEIANDSVGLNEGVRFVALIATIWATLYAANSLGRLVRRSTAFVWGTPYTKLARAWALPFIVIGLSLLAWALTSFGSAVDEWTLDLWVGSFVAEIIVLTLLWLVISRNLPRDPRADRWADLFPGALFVSLGVAGLRVALVVYFAPAVDQLSDRYGSIGLGLVMLTWAYWLGMIIVGSAELNAALFRSRRAHGRR